MSSYHKYSEQQLLDLLKNSDEKAFSEIYQQYADTLFQFAWNILKDENECKDAVQEVFVWLWENRMKLQVTELKYYLLAAVKYKLIRIIQTSKRKKEILSSHAPNTTFYVEEALELKELKAVITQFTQTLPPRAKEIFHLSRGKYFSNREIASKMNITEKTVENQMTITLKKLRHTLESMSFWFIFL